MTDNSEHTTAAEDDDAKLAIRFASLRAAESRSAPPVPADKLPFARVGFLPAILSGRHTLLRIAAGVGIVAVALALLSERGEEDPAALYASIMSKQSMQTDTLLEVSPGILPASRDFPESYEFDIEFDTQTYTN